MPPTKKNASKVRAIRKNPSPVKKVFPAEGLSDQEFNKRFSKQKNEAFGGKKFKEIEKIRGSGKEANRAIRNSMKTKGGAARLTRGAAGGGIPLQFSRGLPGTPGRRR